MMLVGECVWGLMSHSTDIWSFRRRLSRHLIALVLTTNNKETKHYVHQKHKKKWEKTALANKAIYALIWYAFYGLQPGNGVGPILTAPEPTRYYIDNVSWLTTLSSPAAFDIKCVRHYCS